MPQEDYVEAAVKQGRFKCCHWLTISAVVVSCQFGDVLWSRTPHEEYVEAAVKQVVLFNFIVW
jgi:hypothetical protein